MTVARITPDNNFISDDKFDNKIVLVPSVKLSIFLIDLPVKSISQAQKIVAYAIEEEVSENIELLHFSVSPQNGKWLVVVCSHKQMNQWLELANNHGCNPTKFIPDVLALPELVDVLVEPQQILIKNTNGVPFALTTRIAESVMQELDFNLDELETYKADNDSEITSVELITDNRVINLIQGEYSRTVNLTNSLSIWLKVAILACITWVIYGSQLVIENQKLEEMLKADRIVNIENFRKTFPDIQKIINLRTQAQQQFKNIEKQQKLQSSGLINLLNSVVTAAEQNKKVKIVHIRYREHALQLKLSGSTVASVEKLIQSLKNIENLKVIVQSINQDDGKARTTINIRKSV